MPFPGCNTFDASPDDVVVASAGGLATSSGAGIGWDAGGCWAAIDMVNAAAIVKAEMTRVICAYYVGNRDPGTGSREPGAGTGSRRLATSVEAAIRD